ncbi:uncharacterized protein LOC110345135 [Heterocephalus glaber]|uniref:Uncharacterized protein LOC110345135 n=1 Tax=Heterocephalus glaber TaxID=10181 RepID=A0AAX6RJ20_HETGA|nr:uncharacterized protein LOC110345135 [Heterocephalus glaber]
MRVVCATPPDPKVGPRFPRRPFRLACSCRPGSPPATPLFLQRAGMSSPQMFFIGAQGLEKGLKPGERACGRQPAGGAALLQRSCTSPAGALGARPGPLRDPEPGMLRLKAGAEPVAWSAAPVPLHQAFVGELSAAKCGGGERGSLEEVRLVSQGGKEGGLGPCPRFCPFLQPPAPSYPRRTRDPGCTRCALRLWGGLASPGIVAGQQAAGCSLCARPAPAAPRRAAVSSGFSACRRGCDRLRTERSAPRHLESRKRTAELPIQMPIRSRGGNLSRWQLSLAESGASEAWGRGEARGALAVKKSSGAALLPQPGAAGVRRPRSSLGSGI